MLLKILSFIAVVLSLFLVIIGILLNFSVANATSHHFLRIPFDDVNNPLPLYYYFDHNYPNYGNDGEITVYTGESVDEYEPFAYAGHSGYDWPLNSGTPVLAAASGTVKACLSASTYGNYIVIDHMNGYQTLYAHLNSCNVNVGQNVSSGSLIGWSGNTGNSTGPHLHFGVYIGTYQLGNESNATDPFGWSDQGADPLLQYGIHHTAECLWRSYLSDSISCADTIVEDQSENFSLGAGTTWLENQYLGNGYHMYYHNVTTTGYWVDWYFSLTRSGFFRVYAWIPRDNAWSHQAKYYISTGYSYEVVTINQQNFEDEWVYLGTFKLLPGWPGVALNANTGESTSVVIGVDAMKIRVAPIFLPIIRK